MVTLPPHQARGLAEGFGGAAERYDRARPRYPRELAGAVLAGLPGRDVLDVGIGTGISAEPFREAGCAVLGIEPDARMAALARRRGVAVEIGRFEGWDPAGRTFDAVVSGQAWHWVDPVAGAAKAAAVLRPGGRLAAFWNAGEPPPQIAAGFAEVYRSVETGLPFTPWAKPADGYARFRETAADGMGRAGAFGEPEHWRFERPVTVTRAAWLDQVPTAGGHDRIPRPALDALLAGIGQVVDAAGGAFPMRQVTVVVTALRE